MDYEGIIAKLEDMTNIAQKDQKIGSKVASWDLTIMYIFKCDDQVRYYVMKMDHGNLKTFREAWPEEKCDAVIETTPIALDEIMEGTLGGREAFLSGILRFRKTPGLRVLIRLRSMFNRYKKLQMEESR